MAGGEEGRGCANQLNPLNEQLIGGCLDRKLEEAKRRRLWGRGKRTWEGEEEAAEEEEGGKEEKGGGGEMSLSSPPGWAHLQGADRHTAGGYTEGPTGGSQSAVA